MLRSIVPNLLIAICCLNEAHGQELVEYAINSTLDGKKGLAMQVQLSFTGENDGETVLRLPNEWGGQNELYLALRDFNSDQAEILPGDGPATRRLKHAPAARITLHYNVVVDSNGPKYDGLTNDYRVRLERGFLFAIGNAWVVQPESVSDQAEVRVDFSFPEGTAWASDIEHLSPEGTLPFGDLRDSVLIAGNIRRVDAGGGARLAIRGQIESRDDSGWRDSFQRIAQTQRDYWNAGDGPFLVTIIASPPAAPGSISLGGTGLSDAFAFFATSNAEPKKLDQVMAHEMMHTWIPRRIGGLPRHEEQSVYWLSEGFTDWAAWRVLVRSGFWTPADFVRAFNENIQDYDLSPVREAPNSHIVSKFWSDRATSDLPYRRGMLLAAFWDARVREATGRKRDFDDVLLHMQKRATASDQPTTAVFLLIEAMKEMAGLDIADDLRQYVEQGKSIELPGDLFTEHCQLSQVERPAFHRGFDEEATMANGNVVSGVIENSPAWKAGLRDGMVIINRIGGEIGNPDTELVYDLKDGDQLRTLSWFPRGPDTIRFRKLTLPEGLNQEQLDSVRARMGGTNPGEAQED
jgi:predicted metalloprotease with PDZ domain